MATFATKALVQFVAASSETTQYTVAASTTTIVKSILLCNTTATSRDLSISVVPSGGTAGVANRILAVFPLPPFVTAFLDVHIVMETGGFISAICSAASAITVTVAGLEET